MENTEIIYDRETEEATIGCILENPEVVSLALDLLEPSDFFAKELQIIFQAIKNEWDENHSVDVIRVGHRLRQENSVNRIGGLFVLTDLMEKAMHSDPNIEYYCDIVKENANARILIKGCHDIERLIRNDGYNAGAAKLSELMPATSGKTTHTLPKAMSDYYELLLEKKKKLDAGENIEDMTTGLYHLDQQTANERGSMLVIGGSPGSGKSSLMRTIAWNRFRQGKTGILFTTEMPKDMVSACFFAMLSGVPIRAMQKVSMDEDGWQAIEQIKDDVQSIMGWIDDKGALTMQHIQSVARQKKHSDGLDFIAVDYIQKCTGNPNEPRALALERYAYELDALGKELDIHVILVSQLNRAERLRIGRASGAGYKGSAGIEEAGWCVLTMQTTEQDPQGLDSPDLREFITVTVTKDKTEATNIFPLVFLKEPMRFRDATQDELGIWEDWFMTQN